MEFDQQSFERFLKWLDPDKKKAGDRYETLRKKLVSFFEWRQCFHAEECTDIVIDRVISKVARGEEIHTPNPYLYVLGVARNVLREYWKKQDKLQTPIDNLPGSQQPAVDPIEAEKQADLEEHFRKRLSCMQQCLDALPEDRRLLIIGYHQGEKRVKIENRRKLAAWLRTSENALRIRVHRIRDELLNCVEKCLKKSFQP